MDWSRAACSVRSDPVPVAEPFQDRRRNNQFLQDPGEGSAEDLLAREWLRALSAVAGAVVVHVLALFDLAHHHASTMAAAD